ncbi:IS110 family transposase [Catenulispora sp. NL8]|uniref:IS110 family transposase n=1 Tax=Catenulispora pinistramenti TaxID=2705254 RepID=A0ABS5KP03_9ACTN|nr:IS110 family transposase [Catenulispora pinistramenti]MBS2547766.1 IS110 family transposase [Catenulispora pinistramenti]
MDEHAEVVVLEQAVEQVARVAAIDIAKASAMVCTRVPSQKNPDRRVQKTFPVKATTNAIAELADHLVCQSIELVVMEATSDYWGPFFYQLEARGLKVRLVNARDVKNVPGRPKTDKLDAIWLAKLAERGMLRPSFVPGKPVRQLRGLTRLRTALTEDRSRYRNRIEKVLEDACLKVTDKTDGASDLFGVSGRAMLDALIAGERNPRTLAELAQGRMRAKIPKLVEAVTGHFEDHHAYLIGMLLDDHDRLTAQIQELTARIEAVIAELDPTPPPDPDHPTRMPLLDRLDEIPGVGRDTAAAIIAKTKIDGSTARTVARICRADLIVIDDIGMLPVAAEAAEAFYRIIDAAYERRSIAVTSNIHPSGFDSIMPKTIATAAVDRLLHHAHLVLTSGDSHRLAQALAGKGVVPLN